MDEYHPKATRTLFVGNLDKDIDPGVLNDVFKEFGEILVNRFIKSNCRIVRFGQLLVIMCNDFSLHLSVKGSMYISVI